MWALGDQGQGNPAKTIKPLVQVQHDSLRLITGAFKATAGAGLEKEVDTPPIPLFTQSLARKHAKETRSTTAVTYTNALTERIAAAHKIGQTRIRKQWRSPRQHVLQDPTQDNWLAKEWQKQFSKLARGKRHPVWKLHHKVPGREL